MIVRGRVWKFGDNVDTDQIIPARYLNTSDPYELAQHVMEDSEHPNFAKEHKEGDIIVAGRNFVERAKQLNTMCTKCHTSKASIEALAGKDYLTSLDNLQKALSAPQVNKNTVFKHLSEIGQYCYRCHNVHLIPTLVQNVLK